jgi:threonine/homoserine/homoserine lactone efflux protein
LIFLFFSALTVGFSGAMMPGSLLTYTIQQSLKTGARAGILISVGHAVLELGLIFLIILGLGAVLQSDIAQAVIGLAGGALLIVMGIQMVFGAVRGTVRIQAEDGQSNARNYKLALSGALISAANPYFLLWWAVIGLGFIMKSYAALGLGGVAVYYFGHITADFIWYVSISALIAKTRNFIKEKPYRILIGSLGGLLVYFGVTFIVGAFAYFN